MKSTLRKIILLLIWIPGIVAGQMIPDQFVVGDFLEVFGGDSLRVYFNCTGAVSYGRCSMFYREGRTDQIYINFSGDFTDHYLDGSLALEATMVDNYLQGPATYYHENGRIKATGQYVRDQKSGIWTYYYNNGKKQQVINFNKETPYIQEYYKRSGRQMVDQGNGLYQGQYYANMTCEPYDVKGELLNGRPEGRWIVSKASYSFIIAREYFEDGQFIRGESESLDGVYVYSENPITNFAGFSPNEHLHLDVNLWGCPGDRVLSPRYRGSDMIDTYYPALNDSLLHISCRMNIPDQWLLIGLKIMNDGSLAKVNVWSSINDTKLENSVNSVLQSMREFEPSVINGARKSADIFFTVIFSEDDLLIPYLYFIQNIGES